MSPRLRNTALALAALVGCKGTRSAEPEPGPPEAELQPAFDPAALAERGPPAPPPLAPLAVLDYGPQGRTDGGADIRIRFNQPVVALGSEQLPDLAGALTLEPPVEGRMEFQTPDLLVFRPAVSLLPAQTYKVKFAAGFTSPLGPRLAQGLEWTFETPRPKASGWLPQGESDARRDSLAIVEFDQRTTLAEVRAHLQASARPLRRPEEPARPVAVRVAALTRAEAERLGMYYDDDESRGRRFTVRAQALWPSASTITVSVAPGLKGELGPLPLDTPWDMSFSTYEAQVVESVGCGASPLCSLEPIQLRLRNPVREREAKKISITPRPRHLNIEIADAWGDAGGREALIQGQFLPGTTYTVRVEPGLKDIYGQTLPGGYAREVRIDRVPALALSSRHGTLIPARKQTIGVETRFVQELRVRWAVLDELRLAEQPWDKLRLPADAKSRSIALRPEGPGGWSSVALDLAELTGDARGAVLVQVEPAALTPNADGSAPESLRGLYRLTDLGPVAVTSLPRAAVQVLRLSDSAPVVGARVSRIEPGPKGMSLKAIGVTGDAGLLEFTPMPAPESGAVQLETLIVDDPATGDRTALATAPPVPGDSGDDVLRPGERLIARVVADRGAYRPGERVKVVGWSAVDTPFARSGLGRLPKGTEVTFTLIDPFGAQVATRKTTTTAEGKYWAELAIPGEGKLGRYVVKAALAGGEVTQEVKVEDYRVPEFNVTASVKQRDLLTGEKPTVRVAANYYFGGAVPISRLALQTTCWPDRYRPPGLDGTWAVGVAPDYRMRVGNGPRSFAAPRPEDRPGLMEVTTSTAHVGDERPHRCTISAEVMDASMQAIGAETGVQLHPAPFYLAIGVPQGHKQAGDRAAVPLRAVEIAGARTAASGAKLVVERTWSEVQEKEEGGRKVFAGYVDRTEAIKTCTLELAASGDDARCELPPLKEGRYTLRASVGAGDKRKAESEGSFWVARGSRQRWVAPTRSPYLDVEASATSVTPGEAVEVAVQAPWKGGRGLLVLDRQGIRELRPFAIGDGPATFRLETDDTWTPAVHVRAVAVAPMASTTLKERPDVQIDEVVIAQGAEHRRLQVRVDAPAKAGPGDRIELAATVRDGAGAPVGGRVALWAVDEAVLALTDYEVPDLLPAFLPNGGAGARVFDDYSAVIMPYVPIGADPWMSESWGYGRGYGAGMGGRASRSPSVRGGAASVTPPARERFETTPIFLADLAVDAKGEARVKATLPDNLTTFRIFAVASARLVDGTSPGRFGVGDARTTVTTPFIVRAATPRQLRPGDTAEVRAIVQNYGADDGVARVELALHDDPQTPGQDLVAMSPRTAEVAVPAGGQAFVPFQIRADGRGEAKLELRATLQVGAAAAGRDAVKIGLPVEPERTLTERVAMYGSTTDDRAIAIPVALPGAIRPDVGGVSVSASSSLLGGLADAVDALLTYPYGCVEQTSSRLLPIVALLALHKEYPLGLDEDPKVFVREGVARLLAMQTSAGGFAYWPGGQEVHPYASAYATWVLWLADQHGYPVPKEALERAIADLERRIGGAAADVKAAWSPDMTARAAIGLHVLAEVGRAPRAALDAAFARRADMPTFGRAFLLMAMHRSDPQRPEVQTLTHELLGNLEELPATAHTIERVTWDWGPYFHSDGRSDAIVLLALLRARPESAVIEKLARGLLERRSGGKWRNTQENAYALVALAEYARVREAEPPDFVGRAWVGRKPVFEASFLGRELTTRSATAAMPEILQPAQAAGEKPAPLTVVLQREGQGRMYYRLGAEWALSDPRPPARAHGLTIERRLRLQDGPLGEREIKAGDSVAVDLTLSAETRIRYVALDIPIPAGLEAIQLELGKGQRASTLSGPRGWWVSHEELRRDRVVVFADDLAPGTHRHTVYLRATSRGEFDLPPAHAEAMYMPEVWGRSEGARVAVR